MPVDRGLLHLYRLWVRGRSKLFSRAVAGDFRAFGANTTIDLPTHIFGESRISIGSGGHIEAHVRLMTITRDARLTIGDRAKISFGASISVAQAVTIGNDVAIARGCHIADNAHSPLTPGPLFHNPHTDPKPVVLEDGCWVGLGSVVNPGVRIGRDAVIGAYSLVRDDIPAGAIAAGVPCRVIRIRDGYPQPELSG